VEIRQTKVIEIVGMIAVVLSVVFLAMEIRQSNRIAMADSYSNSIEQLNQWRLEVVSDPLLLETFVASDEYRAGSLSPIEERRTMMIYTSLLAVYESSYFSFQYGVLGQEEWSRFESRLCQTQINNPAFLQATRMGVITEDFKSYIDAAC
jgi:hypothetical protein